MNLLCTALGHKYRPRFSTHFGPPTVPERKMSQDPQAYAQVLEASKERRQVYVCDVCERCGHIIKSAEAEDEPPLELSDLNPAAGRKGPKRSTYETVHPGKNTFN